MESGGTWRTMQFLRHIVHKKLTHVIKFTEISLLRAKFVLTSWLLTNCFFNKPLSLIWTSFGLNRLILTFFSIRLSLIKPLMLDWIGSLMNRLPEWIISPNSSFDNLSKWVCLTCYWLSKITRMNSLNQFLIWQVIRVGFFNLLLVRQVTKIFLFHWFF